MSNWEGGRRRETRHPFPHPVAATGLYLAVALVFTAIAAGLTGYSAGPGRFTLERVDSCLDADPSTIPWRRRQCPQQFLERNIFSRTADPCLLRAPVRPGVKTPVTGSRQHLLSTTLFLSTFALSGLGMFLFAREITGSAKAGSSPAFLRIRAVPRAAVLASAGGSSQWMPFVLYASALLRDEAHTPLAGAGAALSRRTFRTGPFCCSSPFVLGTRSSDGDRKLWADSACGCSCLHCRGGGRRDAALPFPYLDCGDSARPTFSMK